MMWRLRVPQLDPLASSAPFADIRSQPAISFCGKLLDLDPFEIDITEQLFNDS